MKSFKNLPRDISQDELVALHKNLANTNTKLFLDKTNVQFYSIVLNLLDRDFVANEHIETAAIELIGLNYRLVINPDFWNSNNLLQKYFILLHETQHVVFNHPFVSKNYNSHRDFNEAADLYINSMLIQELGTASLPGCNDSNEWNNKWKPLANQIQLDYSNKVITKEEAQEQFKAIPMRLCVPDDYDDPELTVPNCATKGTDWIYARLQKIRDPKIRDPKEGGGNGGGSSNGSYFTDIAPTPSDHDDWEKIKSSTSKDLQKAIEHNSDNRLREVAENVMKSQGTIPNALKGLIDKLLNPPKPIVDWKGVVRNWVGGNSNKYSIRRTRMKVNLKIDGGYRLRYKKLQHICIGTDTSGSVSKPEYKEFMMEILNIQKLTKCKITVVECDAYVDEVKGVYEVTSIDQVSKRLEGGMVTGGGGTSVKPLYDHVRKHKHKYSALIYFTDLYLSPESPLPPLPVLTVVSSRGVDYESAKANWNTMVLKIPKDYSANSAAVFN